jgi:catechol 2,3-dioxygenase-like lactoylglutathione lyase family enzyme
MFDQHAAYSSFAAPDIGAERRFFGDKLGLKTNELYGGEALEVGIGDRQILIYRKPDFTPATYTVLNFPVPDVDKAVDELTSKGIQMARFAGFDQDEKGISRDERGPTIAWFRDPAGNIIAIHAQEMAPS